MKTLAVAYVATLVAFLAIDALWLSRMGPALYRPVMGDMVLERFRPAPALVFYLIYIAALIYFAVWPGLAGGWRTTAINAAIFGFAAYATYDLTNQATLKNWSTTLSVADMVWGAFVSTVGASLGRWAALWIAPPAA